MTQTGDPLDMLRQMKFDAVGYHPIEGHALCQIASNSDPLFASNIDPSSLELIHVMHRRDPRP